MPKTMLRARQDGVTFFLNTETSSPNTGHRNRYRLFRTSQHGRSKDGWIQVGSQDGQKLLALADEHELFLACQCLFERKRPKAYHPKREIRGRVGAWEGEAFKPRAKKLTHQLRVKAET
ncbi:hypothetical protein [Pseudomonas plecoglossicida]|uniref:hypothetical protein n=1 Tax=Pseudomonas plecoglossicida TaxID=70775 RepID=UPI00069617E6|nr:hypothetical protein [Pseudomonas plecoglossicida]